MDSQSSASTRSSAFFVQIRRVLAILSFVTFIVLEIYACYSLSHGHLHSEHKINTSNFRCDKNIDIGDTLHVNICNRLINIFQNWNNTLNEVTLTDSDWDTLTQLLR